MERVYGSNSRSCTEVCHLLFTIAIGLLSCSAIAVLTYFTYEATAGNMSYCTLWTDIPGRFALFIFFYYVAGSCGILPIPECCRIKCLKQPFIVYKLESWRYLLEYLSHLPTFNYRDSEISFSDDPEKPLLQQRSTENIPFSINVTPEIVKTSPHATARNRHAAIASCSRNLSLSFDSPIGGHIVPMAKQRTHKPRYLSELSQTSTESGISEMSTLPRFSDAESSLPNYPRFPWIHLKHEGGVPKEAIALHKRHLIAERQEIDRYKRKQRVEETKDSEHEWITDSDINFTASRPLRLPLNLPRRKTGFRGRTRKNTTGGIRKQKFTLAEEPFQIMLH